MLFKRLVETLLGTQLVIYTMLCRVPLIVYGLKSADFSRSMRTSSPCIYGISPKRYHLFQPTDAARTLPQLGTVILYRKSAMPSNRAGCSEIKIDENVKNKGTDTLISAFISKTGPICSA